MSLPTPQPVSKNGTQRPPWVAGSVFALLALALLLGTGIGQLVPTARPWALSDVRLLDTSLTPDPATDITAIYTRLTGFRCEIRLDFLDLPETPQYQFKIAIGNRTTVIENGLPLTDDARLTYDPVTDVIVITLRSCAPPAETALSVQTASEKLETTFGARPALQPLSLRFVFYNIIQPAATPARTLRRWDGAHTGPRGERHGLHGLLETAEKHNVPLTLLGLKTPDALSAMDAAGGLGQLRRMEQAGLLNMPLALPGGSNSPGSAFSQAVAEKFGLNAAVVQHPASGPVAGSFEWQTDVLSREGLPLDWRRDALLRAVQGGPELLLGGDFQLSTWGTYEYADAAFAWLAERPYFQFAQDQAFEAAPVTSAAPQNPIALSALEMRSMLAAADVDLAKNYAGLPPVLEAAAAWSEHPAPVAECRNELCVLASEKFYAVLSPLGGRLVFFFAGKDQLVGPTAQFFIGLSDRSVWDLAGGEGADPAQIMGAFADAENAFRAYRAQVFASDRIRFVSEDGREKIYRLTGKGLEVSLSGPLETKIPLVVAPQARFSPGWAGIYRLVREVGGIRFGLVDGPIVRIQVTGGSVLAADSFLDAIPSLAFPENPNAENPPGFYLPFPLAVVSVSGSGSFSVTIGLTN